jgi:hypothetical protein
MNLAVNRFRGRKGPARALILECNAEWSGLDGSFLIGMSGRLLHGGTVICEPVSLTHFQWPEGMQAVLRRQGYFQLTFVAPMDAAAINAIESTRGGQDVELAFEYHYQYQGPETQRGVFWEVRQARFNRIPRSDWLKILQEM